MLKKLLSLLSDASIYGFSSLLGQFAGFLLLPLYTKFLAKSDYGILAMLSILMLLFGALGGLGMTTAIFRRYSQATDDEGRRTVLSTGLLSVGLGSITLCICMMPFAGFLADSFVGDPTTTDLVRLCLVAAAFNAVTLVPKATLRARRRVKTMASLNLVQVIVSICTTVYFVAIVKLGVAGWVYGTLAAEVTGFLLCMVTTWRNFDFRINLDTLRPMISYGLPIVPYRLQAVGLAQFSQFVVREMLGLDDAGLYAIAVRMALPVALVVNAVQEAWIPFKFQMHAEENDSRPFFRSIFTYYFAAICYLWVGVSLWGFDVTRLMTDVKFHPAAYLVPALALMRVSQGVYFMLGTGIELTDRTGIYPFIGLVGLLTVAVGSFALVGPFGALGAAFANAACWWAMSAVMFVIARRRFGIEYDWPTIGCLAVLGAGCVVLGYAVQPLVLWVRLATYLSVSIIFPLLALALLMRSTTERERVRMLLLKLRGAFGLTPTA